MGFPNTIPANVSTVRKLTVRFIAIIKFGSRESHLRSTQHQARSHGHAQDKQISMTVFRVVAYGLAYSIWWTGIDFEHRHQSNSNLFYLFKHVGQ